MSAAATRPFDGVAGRTRSAAPPGDAASPLRPREATLRSVAATVLVAIALGQAIEVPSASARSATVALLSFAALALCVAAALALVVAGASASRAVWRAVAATGALVLAGWALPHAIVPLRDTGARGDWAAMPGVACAGLGGACLLLAAVALRPTRAAARGLATAAAVLVALGPPAAAFLVAVGPGPPDGEAAIGTDVRAHVHASAREPDIVLRRGRNGDHYLTRVAAAPRPPAIGRALVTVAAVLFAGGAVASLRRRGVASAAGAPAGQPAGGHGSACSRAR